MVLNLGIVLLNNTDTDPGGVNPLPATIESVSPEPDSIAGPVETITVDLDDSLTGVLLVKAQRRVTSRSPRTSSTASSSSDRSRSARAPARTSPASARGENDVVVLYWSKTRVGGRPKNPASYAWSFNVKAVTVAASAHLGGRRRPAPRRP